MFVQKSHGVELQKGVKRDSTIDIITGFGDYPDGNWVTSGFPFTRVIYMFHMAIFFMASGYLWKDKPCTGLERPEKILLETNKKRFGCHTSSQTAYLFFLNNFFIIIGLYSVAPSSAAALQGASPQVWFDMGTTLKELLKTLLFLGGSQMGGAFWFLRTLFAISVGHALVVYISVTFRKSMKYLPLLAVALTAIVCEVLSFANLSIPTIVRACFSGYLAFWLGIIIREKGLVKYLPKRRWGGYAYLRNGPADCFAVPWKDQHGPRGNNERGFLCIGVDDRLGALLDHCLTCFGCFQIGFSIFGQTHAMDRDPAFSQF